MNAKEHAMRVAMNAAIDYLMEDPEKNIASAMSKINALAPDNLFPRQRAAFTRAVEEKSNWYQLLLRVGQLNPDIRAEVVKRLAVDASVLAWGKQEKMREKHQCNIPWAILLDPTSACNLSCTGCWAAEYGHALNLSFEDIDSIICQGKELGVHAYICTGGEPLVRWKDLVRLCEKHQDCAFLSFTNATLIDEAFCQDLLMVKNFIPAISVEGDREATDTRRGEGTFNRVEAAMDLLKSHGLPFGVSCCYTSENADSIASEEFFDYLIDKGALFAWIFTYMPVGASSPVELMATPEQRESLYRFVRKMRDEKPLFTLDFQHDGEYVGGCIAGGRRYLHINAAGDVEPCVFIHYSNANIHEVSLLDALKSPLFMEYYRNQPFNDNLLRPCPMLENPDCIVEMVEASGARGTDLVEPEDVRELHAKCEPMSRRWASVAERIWTDEGDARAEARSKAPMGSSESDRARFARLGREIHGAFDEERIR